MTGDTAVEVPTVDNTVDNKVEEEVVKSDKEVIAEEEKELIENEKKDEPEKTEEDKEEAPTEPKVKVPLLQKLFGKRKDYVVPKVDEVPTKTEKEVIVDEEKGEKVDEEKKDEEKEEEKKEEEKKEETETVQHRFKKLFSMKKAKKEVADEPEAEEKTEDKEEKKDEEKKDEEPKEDEKVEGEETVEVVAEADVSTTTAEKKTLMQKLMTIKRDLMANKKEDKVEEKEEEKKEEGEEKEGEEAKTEEGEKKEGEEEVKVEEEEVKEDDNKDELGNEKPKPSNRIKKFFSMKRERKPTDTKEKPAEEKVDESIEVEAAPAEEKAEEKEAVPEVMKLHLANRTPVIPSISAMHLKLESWLKFHGVKYENTHDKDNLPATAYHPMQSNDYLNQLADTHDKQMPMQLDADQKNVQIAMTTLVEKNIHFAILSWQCSNIDNILKGYKVNLQSYLNSKAPVALLKLMFKNNFCKSGQKLVKSNGFGQKTTDEIEELAKPDLKVLADMLSDNDFFFGASASLLDLVVFSHLVQVTVVEEGVTCALRDHIKAEHENLVAHVDRMKTLIWGEDWVAATEKLDLNPHIPKPIVEEVKLIVDEVVEKVTEEKPTEEKPTEEKPAEEKVEDEKVEEVVETVEESKTEESEKTD